MELSTISDIFDMGLNSPITGVVKDEYEKSVLLTRAQDVYYDAILKNFEVTNTISEKIDRLLITKDITTFTDDLFSGKVADLEVYTRKVLRERITFTNTDDTIPIFRGTSSQVREERLSEIESSLDNPFRKPGEHFVLRAIQESLSFNNVSLYIPKDTKIEKYTVTLAIEPEPIILEDLPDGLTIREKNIATIDLQFKDKDIEKIIEIAVAMALNAVQPVPQEETTEK